MTVQQNGLCECCKEVESARSMCDFCETLVPHITGQQTGLIQDEGIIERFRNELRNPESDISQIWRRVRAFGIENNKDSFAAPSKDQEWLFGEPPVWSLSEEDMIAISTARTSRMDDSMSRRLARGGYSQTGHTSLLPEADSMSMGTPAEYPSED